MLLNGRIGISPEMAIRLSQAFGGSPESWLQQQLQYDLRHVQQGREEVPVRRFAAARPRGPHIVDMPDPLTDLLFRFLHQDAGTLSRRRREREFAALADDEVARIESIYREEIVGDHC